MDRRSFVRPAGLGLLAAVVASTAGISVADAHPHHHHHRHHHRRHKRWRNHHRHHH